MPSDLEGFERDLSVEERGEEGRSSGGELSADEWEAGGAAGAT